MKSLLRLLLLIFPVVISAQISEPEILFRGHATLYDVAFLDLNGDALEDFVALRWASRDDFTPYGGVYIYKAHESDGEIVHSSEILSNDIFEYLFLIDIDLDGDKDVFLQCFNTQENCHKWARNTNGSFELREDLPDFFSNQNLKISEIIDLNGDGIDDVIFRRFANHNDTLFTATRNIDQSFSLDTISTETRGYDAGDINKDGIIDFVIEKEGSADTLLAILSDSVGYQNVVIDSIFTLQKRFETLVDFTGDGTLEFVYQDRKRDGIYMIDDIESDNPIHILLMENDFGGIYFLDFDFDGAIDIYINNGTGMGLYDNNGNGTFEHILMSIDDFPIGEQVYSSIDTAAKKGRYYYFDAQLQQFRIENDSFISEVPAIETMVLKSLDAIELYDIDKDGYEELFFASRWGHSVAYLKGLPNKNFGDIVSVDFGEEGAYNLSLNDFDGDGLTDIAYASIWGGNLAIKFGDGNGRFSRKEYLKEDWGFVRGLAVADFEKDGFPDIALSTTSSAELILYRNHEGIFLEPEVLDEGPSFDRMEARDIDYDGDVDIVAKVLFSDGSRTLRVYENGGNGNMIFEGMQLSPGSTSHYFIDFDHDGLDELIVQYNDQIFISKFNGISYPVWKSFSMEDLSGFSNFVVIDYNGDDFWDIIVEDNFPISHRLYQNIQNETFVFDDIFSEKYHFELPEFRKIDEYVVDLDSDGDLDIIYHDQGDLYRISDVGGDLAMKGFAYWDVDHDTIFDSNESGIRDIKIHAKSSSGQELVTFTDQAGLFSIYADTGEYMITAEPISDCWDVVHPEGLSVQLNESGVQNLEFPFNSEGGATTLVGTIGRAPTRCGFWVRYFVSITNTGCSEIFGKATFDLDIKINNFTEISLDEYTLDGNQIQIPFESLLPGEKLKFNLLVEIPGFEFIDQVLKDAITIKFDYQDGSDLDQEFIQVFSSRIRCAIDPNDKIVTPDRRDQYTKSYVLDEEILYTIRFQNTGNDTAFNIRLEDTISTLLDLSTFRPIDASHPYRIQLDQQERSFAVYFDHVLLPDSNVNQIASNGFFTFSIQPVKELPDFTPIYNTAAIYFDFNPPVITNKLELEYVSDLSLITTQIKEVRNFSKFVFPNPSNGNFRIDFDQPIEEIYIVDVRGLVVPFYYINNEVELQNYQSGLIYVIIKTSSSVFVDRLVVMKR